eukprot:6200657-Pleurochrysis_carterae.AAC.3
MGGFFMSVNHSVQWEIEDAMGVPVTIVSIMKPLIAGGGGRGGLTGKYETTYGMTDPVEVQKGLGQRDLLSPDDGIIFTDSIHALQLAMEVMWVMTKILGLEMQIKGKKKTACSGVYYNEEGKESDILGWEVILPDGEKIPQLKGAETYRYLGTHLKPGRARGGSIWDTRKIIAEKTKRIIFAVGRLLGLTQEQLGRTLALGVAGVLGYHARSTPMDMTTCKNIARRREQRYFEQQGMRQGGLEAKYITRGQIEGWKHMSMHMESQRQHSLIK